MRGRGAGRIPLLPALRQVAAEEDRVVLPRPPGRGRRRTTRIRLPHRATACPPQRVARGGGGGRNLPRSTRVGPAGALPPLGDQASTAELRLASALAALGLTLSAMTLELATAGESHGPALVAIVSGLPAGVVLEQDAIDADLRRRQQGYGRSPRQQIETDEVEVLAGLRHGRTLGTPLALVVRNRDHKNWTWGMSPWPPEGEPSGKGTKPVTLPRPGHADLAGVQKFGHEDVRDALERASARHTAVHVAAGAVAKALLAEIGVAVAGVALAEAGADPDAVDAARADRDTLGGI